MLVKVINDNVHPYKEKFRGRDINIPPKGSIEMDLNDAHMFLGTMNSIEVDGGGTPLPTSYKMLRISTDMSTPIVAAKNTVCMACNKDLLTEKALASHSESEHFDAMIDEDAKEVIVKRRGRPPTKG